MGRDTETREKILKSAKQEFLEKGYMQASLRNICKNAGVTTGALYFFFQDKEDLFANLVQEPLEKIQTLMSAHYQQEMTELPQEVSQMQDFSEDLEISRKIIGFMYDYQDEFHLLLEKSQGTRFENMLDAFVNITHQHNKTVVDSMTKNMGISPIDEHVIHWVSHITIYAHVMLFTHVKSKEEAMKRIEDIVHFILGGWIQMFQVKK